MRPRPSADLTLHCRDCVLANKLQLSEAGTGHKRDGIAQTVAHGDKLPSKPDIKESTSGLSQIASPTRSLDDEKWMAFLHAPQFKTHACRDCGKLLAASRRLSLVYLR